MSKIDTEWFMERIVSRHKSLRKFTKLMHGRNGRPGLNVAAVSLMLHGKRGMTIEEARQISNLLGEDLNEVIKRASGIK